MGQLTLTSVGIGDDTSLIYGNPKLFKGKSVTIARLGEEGYAKQATVPFKKWPASSWAHGAYL